MISGGPFDWSTDMDLTTKEKIEDMTIEPKYLRLRENEPIYGGNFGIIYMGQLFRNDMCITVNVRTLRG